MTDEERSLEIGRLVAAITALVPAPPAHVRERGGSDLLVYLLGHRDGRLAAAHLLLHDRGEGLTRGETK
jgi:hypothetical protein